MSHKTQENIIKCENEKQDLDVKLDKDKTYSTPTSSTHC